MACRRTRTSATLTIEDDGRGFDPRGIPDDRHGVRGMRERARLAGGMLKIAARHGTTVAAVALAWTLAWPAVTAAIVGARSPAQVDGWFDAAALRLTPEDLQDIAAAIAATGAGSGPIQPDR